MILKIRVLFFVLLFASVLDVFAKNENVSYEVVSRKSSGISVKLTEIKLTRIHLEFKFDKKIGFKEEQMPLFVSQVLNHYESPLNCRFKKKKFWDCLSKNELTEGQLLIRIMHSETEQTSFVFDLPLRKKK